MEPHQTSKYGKMMKFDAAGSPQLGSFQKAGGNSEQIGVIRAMHACIAPYFILLLFNFG